MGSTGVSLPTHRASGIGGLNHESQLITIKKVTTLAYPPPSFDPSGAIISGAPEHVPAHKDFREKYFQGFKKGEDTEGAVDGEAQAQPLQDNVRECA